MQALIVGYGDIGKRVAQLLLDRNYDVLALIRSLEKAKALKNSKETKKIKPVIADLDKAPSLSCLVEIRDIEKTCVFYFAPPNSEGETDTRLQNFIGAFNNKIDKNKKQKKPAKLIYISTSGVYGDHQDAWVDETASIKPKTARAKRRRSAELQCLAWYNTKSTDICILRVPGIYGPGRLPIEKIKKAEPVIDPKEAKYTNLIHADDLARVCIATMEKGLAGEIYNVSDGIPLTSTDYYLMVAEVLNLEPPSFISMAEAQNIFSPMRLSFLNESRRLNVDKMLSELKPEIQYQNIKDGIVKSI